MELILNFFYGLNNFLWSYVLIIMLVGLGLYFTARTGFVQFRMLKDMFLLLGKRKRGTQWNIIFPSFLYFNCIKSRNRKLSWSSHCYFNRRTWSSILDVGYGNYWSKFKFYRKYTCSNI